MLFKRSFESRLNAAGGAIRNLLEQARSTQSEIAALQDELLVEVGRLNELRVDAGKVGRLADKLIALSEEE